ncbi:MAG: hypothetical protein JJU02_08385 [Cryomorphaceae bacterium]|nr:hypothetical protein [Cryomorphaceae bacterium]
MVWMLAAVVGTTLVVPTHALALKDALNANRSPSAPGMGAAAHRLRGRTAAWAAEAATVGAAPARTADVGHGGGGYSGQPDAALGDLVLEGGGRWRQAPKFNCKLQIANYWVEFRACTRGDL